MAQLLPINYVLRQDFRVVRFIGRGGFAQIYEAHDTAWNNNVAIKIARIDGSNDNRRMILEVRALLALTNTDHSPEVLACGQYDGFIYIVMDLLGASLRELRQIRITQRALRSFSILTTVKIGLQMIDALEAVHRVGFLHRDVKPANMCIGGRNNASTIYLVDYNMTRRYRDPATGNVFPAREVARFRGTHRYASLTTHDQQEQGPKDDLWGLFYTLAEFSEGALPWHQLIDREAIRDAKRRTTVGQIFRTLPAVEMRRYAAHLHTLRYNHLPDYQLLKSILLACLPDGSLPGDSRFDWEAPRA